MCKWYHTRYYNFCNNAFSSPLAHMTVPPWAFSRLIDKILTKFLFSNQKIRFGNFKKVRFNQNKTMEDHYMDRPKRMPFKRSES